MINDLKSKNIDIECLICHKADFDEMTHSLPIEVKEDNLIKASDFLPIQFLRCTNCGYLHLFNI